MIRFALCLVLGLGLLVLGPVASARAGDTALARSTVEAALKDGLGSFAGTTLPIEERRLRLDRLLRTYSAPPLLSARVLGRYWAKTQPQDQTAFADLLIRFMVSSYAGLLVDVPTGITFTLGEPTDLGTRVRVPCTVTMPGPGGESSPVEWEVTTPEGGGAAIVDLTVEGVSLLRAMHEDFASVLRGSGGQIDPLLQALRAKIATNEQAAPAP
jgi:ABC-type transporter MlaC component